MNLNHLDLWSWRRDLNPRPSDYKTKIEIAPFPIVRKYGTNDSNPAHRDASERAALE